MATTEAVYTFAAGIDRRPPEVEGSASAFADMDGLVPEAHGGVTVLGGDAEKNIFSAQTWGHGFSYYQEGEGWEAYGVGTTGIFRLTSSFPLLYPAAQTGQASPSAAVRKGEIFYANPPNPLVRIPIATPGLASSVQDAPKGNVTENFFGAIWVAGCETDVEVPQVGIPLYAYGLPAPSTGTKTSGTGDVASFILTDSSGTSGVFTGAQGKIILIGGDSYRVKTVTTKNHTDDSVEVYPINDQPDDGTGYAWELLPGDIITASPGDVDFGECRLFTDSAPVSIRLKNNTSVKQTILGVVPSGPEVILTALPNFPLSVSPGGSVTLQAKMRPQERGARSGSLTINIGSEAQSSIIVQLHAVGTLSKVLHESCVDFGSVMSGAQSQERSISITNSTGMDIALMAGSWNLSPGFVLVSPSSFPTSDVTLKNGESYKITLKASPSSGGQLAGALTFQRKVIANPGRAWFSFPDDPTCWDIDTDWVDVASLGQASKILALVAYDSSLWAFTRDRCVIIQPGGVGKFRVVQGQGFFFGVWSRASVCTGGGALWWAGPEGVFMAVGQEVRRISDKIHDVVANSSSAAVSWCGDKLAVALNWATGDVPTSIWFYSPDRDAWFRRTTTSTYPIFLTTREPGTLCGVGLNNKSYVYGQSYGAEAPSEFSAKTRFLVLSYPDAKKRVLSGRFFVSEPSIIQDLEIRGTEGQLAWAAFQAPRLMQNLVPYGSGKIKVSAGYADISEIVGARAKANFSGCVISVDGTLHTVQSGTTSLVYAPTLSDGEYIAVLGGASRSSVLTLSYYCVGSAGGGAIQLLVNGAVDREGLTLHMFTLEYDVTAGIHGAGMRDISP